MSEELVKESIERRRRDTRAKWLILHLQHTKQSKCESAFLPLSLSIFLSDGQNGRKEGRNKVVNCQRVDIFAWPDKNSCLEFDNIHIKVERIED